MIHAEQCFYDVNNSPVRYVRGRVELYNGSTLLHTFKHTDRLKEFTIERIGDTSKFFGYGICQKANIKVLDINRELNITTDNTLDIAFGVGCDFLYSYPFFQVSEVHRDELTNELSITAYDALNKATRLFVADLEVADSYTIYGFTAACAAKLGVSLTVEDDSFNLSFAGGANFEGTETLRDALNAVAEATQTVYYINHEQSLVFKRLDISGEPVAAIDKTNYYTLESSSNRRLAAISSITELGDNYEAKLEVSGTTQYVRNNPFWDLREDIATLVDNALDAIGGLTINQFDCEWRGNFLLEVGDKVSITNKDNELVYSYILDDVITYDGSLKEKTRWSYTNDDTEQAANPTNLGESLKQTFAKVDKVNKEVEIVVSELDNTKSSLAELVLNTDTITATVEQTTTTLENLNEDIANLTNRVNASVSAEDIIIQIQSELGNGVNRVVTETGYKFDNEGLSVAKSDSEMKTTITDDGMKVYKNDDPVLTANNTGVNAINLHATTYLIIGTNSRLEDFGGGRTGCFWIGG